MADASSEQSAEPARPRETSSHIPETDPDEPRSLAALLAELQNRPLGDRRLDRVRARTLALAERHTSTGPLGSLAEVDWLAARRDSAVGGTVLAGALAYRIFIWLLPPPARARARARAGTRRRLDGGCRTDP